MTENELSKIIIGKAIEVHKTLGQWFLESAYQECLFFELQKTGLLVVKEKPMSIIYRSYYAEIRKVFHKDSQRILCVT